MKNFKICSAVPSLSIPYFFFFPLPYVCAVCIRRAFGYHSVFMCLCVRVYVYTIFVLSNSIDSMARHAVHVACGRSSITCHKLYLCVKVYDHSNGFQSKRAETN